MVENDVTIFFHGHDHFFAKQELDGVIYQLGPQPSHPNYRRAANAEAYGYVNGEILPNSGHLRVRVSDADVTVVYVRAFSPEDESSTRQNGEVAHSYTISALDTRVNTPRNVPTAFILEQNYPNPFNPQTTISYYSKHAEQVKLSIINLLGKEIQILIDGYREVGYHSMSFNAKGLSSGVYFYKLEIGSEVEIKKMIFLQ